MNTLLIRLCRFLFWGVFARFVVLIYLGLNVRRPHLLPKAGPAIIIANHNSHLDTLVLISLYSHRQQPRVRPVAAADYFMRNKLLTWFSVNVLGIIPLARSVDRSTRADLFEGCRDALDQGDILILYPEGSRGDPEHMTRFKAGITHLLKSRPDVPVTPVYMHGLGKALPRHALLPVPFFCDVFIGNAIEWRGNKAEFMAAMDANITSLREEQPHADWS